ncbi:unnamed protein product [Didymodactylos carnosus]|uniref:Uncharacterized protein n=3 Tax=Didymodactylos carnosus TaxID=1234261 RepID=A0A815DIP3_9BILA|nr:unnamed protein product [Didymodactylos carnosus]CAF4113161.1 unnamed protein product [Didymodactylos carnosus]
MNHLPDKTNKTDKFNELVKLMKTIFKSTNTIYAWGRLRAELEPFSHSGLFQLSDIPAKVFNVQRRFREWYNDRHPHTEECQRQKTVHNNDDYDDCLRPRTHRPYKEANDQWGLQMAIARTFGQYLDKSSTLANWAVGLDTALGTYMPPQKRERLKTYAAYDCLAVEKLIYPIFHDWTLEQVRNYDQTFTDMVLHVQNEEPAVQDQQQQTDNQDEPSPQVLQQDHDSMNLDLVLHVQNEEPLEQTAEEEDNHHYVQGHQQPHLQSKIVIPPRLKIVNIPHLQSKVVKQRTQYEQKIKNRKGSHWSRRNRYRWEVIQQVFNDKTQGIGFSITMVKQILRSMGIRYTNINMVGQTLFIGTKEAHQQWIRQALDQDQFNEEHYHQFINKNDHPEP